jgi:hypothetical protein
VFFAFYLLQLAYLTFRSTFLPRWLGVLVALGGGWLVFLYPPLARVTSRYTALASIGEVLLVLWLAVRGVDEEGWHEQAGSNWVPTVNRRKHVSFKHVRLASAARHPAPGVRAVTTRVALYLAEHRKELPTIINRDGLPLTRA